MRIQDNGWHAEYVRASDRAIEMERQRDAYAETLREIVSLAREWQGGSERFIAERDFVTLACKARERHPELAQAGNGEGKDKS